MLVVAHTALGIGTGVLIKNPAAAFVVGVLTHHFADATPHFDPGSFILDEPWRLRSARDYSARDWWIVGIDLALTALMLSVLFVKGPSEIVHTPSVWAGIVGANLPDLVHNVPFWNKQLRTIGWIRWWHDKIHRRFQWTVPARLWYVGIGTQLVVLAAVGWLVFH